TRDHAMYAPVQHYVGEVYQRSDRHVPLLPAQPGTFHVGLSTRTLSPPRRQEWSSVHCIDSHHEPSHCRLLTATRWNRSAVNDGGPIGSAPWRNSWISGPSPRGISPIISVRWAWKRSSFPSFGVKSQSSRTCGDKEVKTSRWNRFSGSFGRPSTSCWMSITTLSPRPKGMMPPLNTSNG